MGFKEFEELIKFNGEKQIDRDTRMGIKKSNRFYSRNNDTKDNWETPQYFFELIEEKIERWLNIPNFKFNLDPCCSKENAKCKNFFTIKENGLIQNWRGHNVFVNPPFLEVEKWIEKCYKEGKKENTLVVPIIRASTDTIYWHKYVMRSDEIWLAKGRVNFLMNGKLPKNSSTFPLCIVIFRKTTRSTPKLRSFFHKEKDLIKENIKRF